MTRRDAQPLDPQQLPLSPADKPPTTLLASSLLGVAGDAAPDAWGQCVLLHMPPKSLKWRLDTLLP